MRRLSSRCGTARTSSASLPATLPELRPTILPTLVAGVHRTGGTTLAPKNDAPMFRHATAALLLVGLMLQPLSAAVCAGECGSHARQQSSEPPAEHCAKETSESPGAPKPERPTHESSNCGHSESICAALQAQSTEPSAPPIVQLAVLPPFPSALFGAPVRPSMLVRQSTSPPGCSVRITPLRI
jgi:hypothetical protein